MLKVAIVTAYSEYCYELCRQFVVSCWEAIKQSETEAEYHFFCYECNYRPAEKKAVPFRKKIQLSDETPIPQIITQRDASKIEWTRSLCDMVVYDEFAKHDLDNFDIVLFCHNDVYIRSGVIFDDIINILNDAGYNLIAEVAAFCYEDISLRFRPSFIAVRSDLFRQANLSFINNHQILAPESRRRKIETDGGAELMASYYSLNNTIPGVPFTNFPNNWFKHLRIESDYGVEMHNIFSPNDPQIQKLLAKAKRYSDYHLYGPTDNN